jgi:hypothetical protein
MRLRLSRANILAACAVVGAIAGIMGPIIGVLIAKGVFGSDSKAHVIYEGYARVTNDDGTLSVSLKLTNTGDATTELIGITGTGRRYTFDRASSQIGAHQARSIRVTCLDESCVFPFIDLPFVSRYGGSDYDVLQLEFAHTPSLLEIDFAAESTRVLRDFGCESLAVPPTPPPDQTPDPKCNSALFDLIGLAVSVTVDPSYVCAGDDVTFTYEIKSTELADQLVNVADLNVTLNYSGDDFDVDGGDGFILAPMHTQTFTRTTPVTAPGLYLVEFITTPITHEGVILPLEVAYPGAAVVELLGVC